MSWALKKYAMRILQKNGESLEVAIDSKAGLMFRLDHEMSEPSMAILWGSDVESIRGLLESK